jgi:antitoxin ParD1/3/4
MSSAAARIDPIRREGYNRDIPYKENAMEITLPPDLEEIVNEKVERGNYNSVGDVVRDALRLMNDRDAARHHQSDEIRRKVAVGLEEVERGETVGFASGAAFTEHIRTEGEKLLAARLERANKP